MNRTHVLENSVFLDKTAIMAIMDADNPYYPIASAYFLELDDLERNFITTNHIIFTIHQWLTDNYGFTHADFYLKVIDKAVNKEKLWVIPGNSELEQKSRQLLMEAADYELSLEEALNAMVISHYGIKRIFTFNRKYTFLTKMNEQIKVIPSSSR